MKLFSYTLVALAMLGSSVLVASPLEYRIDINSAANLRGLSLDAGAKSVWTNNTNQAVTLTFGSETTVGRVTLEQPADAESFTREIAAGASTDLRFAATGFYRFALTWADGQIKSGELAVATPEVITIDIIGVAFSPQQIRVKRGQRIRWINTTSMVHTVTADPALALDPANVLLPDGASTFDSGDILPGQTFVTEFSIPGEYKYFCKPHERMGHVGTIIVE